MRIYVCQLYIEAGAGYPFTHRFQKYLSSLLSDSVVDTATFHKKFGDDFDLVFNMSAKSSLAKPEVRGPTVFNRNKTVEYSIFLPFAQHAAMDQKALSDALEHLLVSITAVLAELGLSAACLTSDRQKIVSDILNRPEMTGA